MPTTVEQYRKDPCGTSALAWHKTEHLVLPPGMTTTLGGDCSDGERYFRLVHYLRHVPRLPLAPCYTMRRLEEGDLDSVEELVRQAYVEERLPVAQQRQMRALRVFDADLWLGIFFGGELVAASIAEFDAVVPEGVVDWVQVLPSFRGQGLAAVLLGETLARLEGRAEFVTVAGRCDNSTHPEALYRRCGFEGDAVWCVRFAGD